MAGKGAKRDGPVTLKPVGVSDDGMSVMLARRANAKGGYRLAIDEALIAQLDAARSRIAERAVVVETPSEQDVEEPARAKATSKLTIKEIQVLLRQGKTVAAVAKRAGVEPAWVERFEPPIVWERAGMAQRAQRATLYRARMGPSGLPLGEAVEASLKSRRIALEPDAWADAWDSVKRARGGRWVVSFRFVNRGRERMAQWEYDPAQDRLKALDTLAAEIGWVPSRRRRR